MTDIKEREDIDVSILEALDFEAEPPTCDYTDCQEPAAAKLVCGACFQGVELMCMAHTVLTRIAQVQQPEATVTFDNTCNHEPELGNCEIRPL